jgi:hypothetical protein
MDLHSHGQSPFLRVLARQRHPRDVQRVREGAERLSPHDAEVLCPTAGAELRQRAVEDVA